MFSPPLLYHRRFSSGWYLRPWPCPLLSVFVYVSEFCTIVTCVFLLCLPCYRCLYISFLLSFVFQLRSFTAFSFYLLIFCPSLLLWSDVGSAVFGRLAPLRCFVFPQFLLDSFVVLIMPVLSSFAPCVHTGSLFSFSRSFSSFSVLSQHSSSNLVCWTFGSPIMGFTSLALSPVIWVLILSLTYIYLLRVLFSSSSCVPVDLVSPFSCLLSSIYVFPRPSVSIFPIPVHVSSFFQSWAPTSLAGWTRSSAPSRIKYCWVVFN